MKFFVRSKQKLHAIRSANAIVASTTLITNSVRGTNGFQIQLDWDSSVAESNKTYVMQGAQKLVDLLTTPVTHIVTVFSATSGLGESETSLLTLMYDELRAIYNPKQNSITKLIYNYNLPATDPYPGTTYIMTPTQYKAFGGSTSTTESSMIFINFAESSSYDLVGVSMHEITETMGRIGGFVESDVTYTSLMDLCSFAGVGTRAIDFAPNSYFSPNNGTTNYSFFNTNTSGDAKDWSGQTWSTDSFNAFATPNVLLPMSTNDLAVLEGLGYFLSGVLCTPASLTTTTGTDVSVGVNFSGLLGATFSVSPLLPNSLTVVEGTIQGQATQAKAMTLYDVNVDSNFISEEGPFTLTVAQATNSGLSAGAIAGIVIGSVAFVVLIICLVYFMMQSRHINH